MKSATTRYCTLLWFELGHIGKLCMVHICICWSVQLELVDPDLTSTCHMLDWMGKSPLDISLPKRANWQSRHISSVHDLFYTRVQILGPNSLLFELNILNSLHSNYIIHCRFHHKFHHTNFFVDWDSGCNEKLRLHPSSLTKSITPCYCIRCHRTHRQTVHAPYTRILGCVAWAGWPGHDLH